ncbi:MAG: methyltransferase domain-containing protein [Solirubrobacteraceae bacterium]
MSPRRAAPPATASFRIAAELPLDPDTTFARTVDELGLALAGGRDGQALEWRPGAGGGIAQPTGGNGTLVAEVRSWEPPSRILLEWRTADWGGGARSEVELRFEPTDVGTRLTFEHRDFGAPMLSSGEPREGAGELLGWIVDQLLAPAARAGAPAELARWLTDRRARRPTGPRARAAYRRPRAHQAGFDATLAALDLTSEDRLLEVGCGGGAFIAQALGCGCRAVAVDHSEEMVRLTAEANAEAVRDGRLEVLRADATRLPLPDAAFTCAAMTHVFFFLEEPVAALAECRRVLRPGGRLAVYTSTAALAGTPAAPEPIVRFMRFYESDELGKLATAAGFPHAEVADLGGAQLLTARA